MIGIDIQPEELKVVQLKKGKKNFQITGILSKDLPESLLKDGRICDWSGISSLLSELVKQLPDTGNAVAISVPANLVRIHRLHLPSDLSDHEVDAEIYRYLARDLPTMEEGGLYLDFVRMPSKVSRYMDVSFVAARQTFLVPLITAIEASGLNVSIIDVDIYAIIRSILFNAPNEKTEFIRVMLYVRSHYACLVAFTMNEVLFHQHWDPNESADWDSQLKERFQRCLRSLPSVVIEELMLCGEPKAVRKMKRAASQLAIRYAETDPFIQLMTQIDLSQYRDRASDFSLVCGLAMRMVPRWSR